MHVAGIRIGIAAVPKLMAAVYEFTTRFSGERPKIYDFLIDLHRD